MKHETRCSCYDYLRENARTGKWAERIIAELGFLMEVSAVNNYSLDSRILPALDTLKEIFLQNGAITKSDAQKIEDELADLSPVAKGYDVSCVAHAHIDMNWMWGHQETACLTIDTFRTMLDLLKEYPQFCFSQSQASVYHLVEEYAPQMLSEIREYIHQGRWELTASAWVESEKNMANGEAIARHLLYTKRYLSKLFDIPQSSLRLDFEPDTFGHPHVMPELLQHGGVDYYYHCRGAEGPSIYNWRAPSGAEVLAYREPTWYRETIEPEIFLHIPSFCAEYGITCSMTVYGVGDHGGGPTRRDLNRILDMATWPLFPNIHFGTMHDFFDKLAAHRSQFETIDAERNYIFTGCYTSQSELKKANRIGEARLKDSEALDVMADHFCADYHTASSFENAWRKVLFNQFHDILPGAGLRTTREFAMGEFQHAMATASVNASVSMHAMNDAIDTSGLDLSNAPDLAYGAGVGYALSEAEGVRFISSERGSGSRRVITVWNPTAQERSDVFELTVWDWPAPASRICAYAADGTEIPVQLLDENVLWCGHLFTRIAVQATIPPMGWTSIFVCDTAPDHIYIPETPDPRLDHITDEPIVLENRYLRAVFAADTMLLKSLVRKSDHAELIDPLRPAGALRMITETTEDMSAWRTGQYANIEILNTTVPVHVDRVLKGKLRQEVEYHLAFRQSNVRVVVTLDNDSKQLSFTFHVDWREFGNQQGTPQLNFFVPLAEEAPTSKCLTPLGFCDRTALAQDVPCNGLMAVARANEAVALLSNCKYGFRNDGTALSVALLRASVFPDATPEIGDHTFTVCVAAEQLDHLALWNAYDSFMHPICSLANTKHGGKLPLSSSLMTLHGASLYALKQSEDHKGYVLRLFNPKAEAADIEIVWHTSLHSASMISILEEETLKPVNFEKNVVRFVLPANSLQTLRLQE